MKSIRLLCLKMLFLCGIVFAGCAPPASPPPEDEPSNTPSEQSVCGDGKVTGGELCDPKAEGEDKCPETCSDNSTNACVTKVMEGTGCSRKCVEKRLTECIHSDGCCPENCTLQNDNDCAVIIAAKVGESCQGDSDCGEGGKCIREQKNGTYPGGYCTASCDNDRSICPVGSTCVDINIDGYTGRHCMKSCLSTCRKGYQCDVNGNICVTRTSTCTQEPNTCGASKDCTDMDGDGLLECVSKPGTAGAPCKKQSDCKEQNTACFMHKNGEGYCRTKCLNDSSVCTDGTVCKMAWKNGPNACVPDCSSDPSVCRAEGFVCHADDKVCRYSPILTFEGTGKACLSEIDCGRDALCLLEAGGVYPGGYCIARCNDANECPEGSVCTGKLKFFWFQFSYCEQACISEKDCREGYMCEDGACKSKNKKCSSDSECLENERCLDNGIGTTRCYRAQIPQGEDCFFDAQCAGEGGECLLFNNTRGFCTKECSNTNDECSNGMVCRNQNKKSYCMNPCSSTNECSLPDMACLEELNDKKYCWRKNPKLDVAAGDACASKEDCGIDGYCILQSNVKNGFCSADCTAKDCPSGSVCLRPGRGKPFCARSCQTNDECRPDDNLVCKSFAGNAQKSCLPR